MEVTLGRALDAGKVELRGAQLYQGGKPSMPRLDFVAEQESATSTAAAGIQRSGGQHDEHDKAYPMFAALPANRLVPAEKATADRAHVVQQRDASAEPMPQRREAQKFEWAKNFAPLPPDALTRKHR